MFVFSKTRLYVCRTKHGVPINKRIFPFGSKHMYEHIAIRLLCSVKRSIPVCKYCLPSDPSAPTLCDQWCCEATRRGARWTAAPSPGQSILCHGPRLHWHTRWWGVRHLPGIHVPGKDASTRRGRAACSHLPATREEMPLQNRSSVVHSILGRLQFLQIWKKTYFLYVYVVFRT